MTDMQMLTLVITLLAIFGAMYGNRKSTEDMRDVLRAEIYGDRKSAEDMRDVLRAEFRASNVELKSELTTILLRIENKVDHFAETQASHSERLNRLDGGAR
jgi:hypothetical protein